MIEHSLFSQYDFKLIFVGEFVCQHYKKSILDTIEKNNLQDRVIITGFVDDELYKEYLMASDIGLNLRTDSRGETSRALLMNMAYALPTIVNDYATFSEFENETLTKVKLNDSKDFIEKVKLLIANGSIRNGIAANAYKYIMNKHNAFSISDEYNKVMVATSKEKDVKTDIINEIAYEIVNNDLAKDFDIKMYKTSVGLLKFIITFNVSLIYIVL
jgi:glycosyltransferase involved in cell wall biosynthesis